MFCEKCGNKLRDESVFCNNCGAPVDREPIKQRPAEAPVGSQGQNVAQNTYDGSTVNNQVPPMQNTAYNTNTQMPPFQQKPQGVKKPMGGKAKIGIIIVAAVLVVFAGVGAACRLVPGLMGNILPRTTNFIMRNTASPERYLEYAVTEVGGDKNVGDKVGDVFSILKNAGSINAAVEGEVKLSAGEGLKELIADSAGAEAKAYIDWINSIKLGFDGGKSGNIFGYKMALGVNDVDLASVDAVLDMDNGGVYLTIPELNPTAVKSELGSSSDIEDMKSAFAGLQELASALPDEKQAEKLVNKYLALLVKNIGDVEKKSEKVTAGDVSQKYTKLSAEIDVKDAKNMSIAVLKEAKTDKDIKKIITDISNTKVAGADAEEVYNNYVEGIDEMLEQLSDLENDADVTVTVNIWVNGKGEVTGIGYSMDGTELKCQIVEKGSKYGMKLTAGAGMQAVKLDGGGKKAGSKKSGNFALSVMGAEVVELIVEDVDTKKAEEGSFVGKIVIKPTDGIDGLLSMAGSSEVASMLKGARIEITGAENSAKLAVYTNDKLFADLAISQKAKTGNVDVKVPSDVVDINDEEAVRAWEAQANIQALTDNLKKAGAPDELIQMMEMGIQAATAEETQQEADLGDAFPELDEAALAELEQAMGQIDMNEYPDQQPEILEAMGQINNKVYLD